MGYYMRFLVDDDKQIDLDTIEAGLQGVDPDYRFDARDAKGERAHLMLGDELYGQLEINRRGSELMDEEIEEFLEELEDEKGRQVERVRGVLQDCRCIVAVEVLWQGREAEATLDRLDPLWHWLWREYRGLLNADCEGFYDPKGQVL